jgi:hypothetical protein
MLKIVPIFMVSGALAAVETEGERSAVKRHANDQVFKRKERHFSRLSPYFFLDPIMATC